MATPAAACPGGRPRSLGAVLLLVLVLLLAGAAAAAPRFPQLTGRVVDEAQILSPAAEQRLTGELADLEARTGRQVVVATIADLQGYDIADYGYQLGRTWGIGRKGEDDGVVFIVAPNDRKVRIEVGYGLEPVLTDALSSVILQQRVLPRFRAGQMEQGVVEGVEAVVQQLALPEDQARANVAQAAQVQQRAASQDGGVPIGLIFGMLLVFWVLGSLLRGFGGRRRRSSGLWWLAPVLMSGHGRRGGWSGGGGWGGGGFSGGGGSFGGGGSSGSW